MSKTVCSIILKVLKRSGRNWISQGELYKNSRLEGYEGSQIDLLNVAEDLAGKGKVSTISQGATQNYWYTLVENNSLERNLFNLN